MQKGIIQTLIDRIINIQRHNIYNYIRLSYVSCQGKIMPKRNIILMILKKMIKIPVNIDSGEKRRNAYYGK